LLAKPTPDKSYKAIDPNQKVIGGEGQGTISPAQENGKPSNVYIIKDANRK